MFALIALLLAQTAPAAPQWSYKEATDADGKKSATAMIQAADGTGRLVVRCDTAVEPIVSIQYLPRPSIPAAVSSQVIVTFDETKAEIQYWEFPGKGAYLAEAYDVYMIASQIATAKTIRVATQSGELPVQSEFAGPGSDAMFRKVYETCGRAYAVPVVAAPKR